MALLGRPSNRDVRLVYQVVGFMVLLFVGYKMMGVGGVTKMESSQLEYDRGHFQ